MRKDTIVFINRFSSGKLFEDNMDLKSFTDTGYHLVYLDMSKYYYPLTYMHYGSDHKERIIYKEWYVKCETKKEILEWIKKYAQRAWFYVLHRQVSFQLDEMWLYWILKRYKCDYILQDFLPHPGGNISQDQGKDVSLTRYFFNKTLRTIKSFRFKHLLERGGSWFLTYLMGRDIFFKKPIFCFAAGKKSYMLFNKFFPKTNIVEIPSVDYFRYRRMISSLRSRRGNEIPKYDYLLYIDQSVFNSPNAKFLGIYTINENIFFKKINRFFDKLEQVTGKRVVVAATSRHYYKGDEYRGRDIIYDRTHELTYYANLIVVHYSAAINFAVIMYKPILFLTIKEFSYSVKNNIQNIASVLNKEVMDSDINLDFSEVVEFSKVNYTTYGKYFCDYITQKDFDISPSEIIVATLKEYDMHNEHY